MRELQTWIRKQKASGERMSIRLLAKRVDCQAGWLCDIINGKGVPSLSLASRISRETGIPLEKFVPRRAA